jgi:hypothetical protein
MGSGTASASRETLVAVLEVATIRADAQKNATLTP